MTITREQISMWFDRGKIEGGTHLIVVCDTFGHDYYPVVVKGNTDLHEALARIEGQKMTEATEIYHLGSDKDHQLREQFAWHPDPFELWVADTDTDTEPRMVPFELLAKYIRHVAEMEGVDFLSSAGLHEYISAEELAILHEASREADEMYSRDHPTPGPNHALPPPE